MFHKDEKKDIKKHLVEKKDQKKRDVKKFKNTTDEKIYFRSPEREKKLCEEEPSKKYAKKEQEDDKEEKAKIYMDKKMIKKSTHKKTEQKFL